MSGTGEEPVITMELLPITATPLRVKLIEEYGPGGPGARHRERRWTFEWEGESLRRREIKYPLVMTPRPTTPRAEVAALKLAGLAGWPLPEQSAT